MSTTLFRVVNQGLVANSILIDKIDRSQGNSLGYAQKAKQAVYVPYKNPLDTTVRGYIDMVPTDEVLLSMSGNGTLAELKSNGYVTVTGFSSALKARAVITAASHSAAAEVGSQIGTAADIAAAVGGKATVTGLTGMTTGSVGHELVISSGDAANNGTFTITNYISATSVKIANPAAVDDSHTAAVHWEEETEARTTIAGTTMASLSPDITYVILTNLSGATQTITDQVILAAGAPNSFTTTSIIIQDALVTIGTPTTGWTVQVKANSKLSNTFTLT